MDTREKITIAKLNRARNFYHEWVTRNANGNLSAGWISSQGEEIENLVGVFKNLDSVVTNVFTQIRFINS